MKKQDLFALSLAAAMNFAATDDASAQGSWKIWQEKPPVVNNMVIPGSEKIGGSLNSLLQNGNPVGEKLSGQYLLIYFGTPYRMPTCAPDILVMSEAIKLLEERHGKNAASRVTPVLIYPPHDPARQPPPGNLNAYLNKPGSLFVGLTGAHEQVINVARKYGVRYMGGDGDTGGTYASHTRFAYLMDPNGKNLAIFPGDTPYIFIADQLALNLTRDGLIKPETGKTAPGLER